MRVKPSGFKKMAEIVHMIDSEVFLAFSTYATIVVLKMMLMSFMTSYFRLTKQVFSNLEDTMLVKTTEDRKKLVRVDPDVERVRRAGSLHGSVALPGVCGVTFHPHCGLCDGSSPAYQRSGLRCGAASNFFYGLPGAHHSTFSLMDCIHFMRNHLV
ncbi:microsomal glutathione S-transferase 1.1 isoform X2 [Puntigrus tetrazona]|uniref:microsomal glutathione S-transferase 1.1 isoform X2 n=1 Tax=Puntigrus tetrazona TaxID=1606681 RepID=UPI001C8A5E1C|nr:microsomal glutathione S-transferase 1.1 isoform X2 [Puntigrus tetrazona]